MDTEQIPDAPAKRGDSLFHEHDGYPRHALNVKDHDAYFKRKTDEETKPAARGRKAKRDTKSPARPRGLSVKRQVDTTLEIVNTILAIAVPEDALAPEEFDALSQALVLELEAHPEWRVWFERASAASPHFMLFQAIFGIAMARLARRGLIPYAMGDENTAAGSSGADGVPLDARRAYDPGRGYGEREEYASSISDPGSSASLDPAV